MSDAATSDEDKYANESFENESDNSAELSESNSESDCEPQPRSSNPSSLYAYTRARLNRRTNFQTNDYKQYDSSSDDNDDVVVSQTIAEVNTEPMCLEEELSSPQPSDMHLRTAAIAKMVITKLKISMGSYELGQTSENLSDAESERTSRGKQEVSDAVTADEKDGVETLVEKLQDYAESDQDDSKAIEHVLAHTSHFLPPDTDDEESDEVDDGQEDDDLTPRDDTLRAVDHSKDVDKSDDSISGQDTPRDTMVVTKVSTQIDLVESEHKGGTYEYDEYDPNDDLEPFGATSGDDEFQRKYYLQMRQKIDCQSTSQPPSEFSMDNFDYHIDIVKPSTSVEKIRPKVERKSWSFSNERMREIERTNHILLKKILTQKPTYTSNPEKTRSQSKFASLPATTRVTSAAVNRKKKQRQIDLDNKMLKRRIEAISLRRPHL